MSAAAVQHQIQGAGLTLLALDVSLTATGWADSTGQSGVLNPPKGHERGMPRVLWIRERVLELSAGADLVLIEGYSFGAKGNAILDLAELGGVLRVALHDAHRMYVEVPPASVKKFAFGKGNAKKEDMLGEAIRRLGYQRNNHNEADALWLLSMAECHYGGYQPTASQRAALAGVEWPEVTR